MGNRQNSKILTKNALRKIEQEIEKINSEIELLIPSCPNDAEVLYYYDIRLSECLETLESSFKKARTKEIGLSIVR